MTRFVARAAGALTLAALVSGCSFFQRQAFSPPTVVVSDVRLVGIGLQGGRIDVVLSLYNPNNFRLDADALRYKVTVDSLILGQGTIDNRVSLAKKDSTEVRVPVMFGVREVVQTAGKLGQRGSLPFELTGDIRVLTPFGNVTRTFSQRGTYDGLNISVLPRGK